MISVPTSSNITQRFIGESYNKSRVYLSRTKFETSSLELLNAM